MAVQSEWLEKDYYKLLGVADSASDKEITRAYRKLARQLHPDANPGDTSAEERFKEVSAAYDVLGDADKRRDYDEARRLGSMTGASFGTGAGSGGFNIRAGSSGAADLSDLGGFEDLFGGMFATRSPSGAGHQRGRQRGRDLEAELHLSFEDAVRGVTTTVPVNSDVACTACGGGGARPGTAPTACPQCRGRGVVPDHQGVFGLQRSCPRCGGAGQIVTDPCPSCGGRGTERRTTQVKVRVPAGVDDGQTVRIAGRGGPGLAGAPSGDLLVLVRVGPHPLFGRRGANLTLEVPITFPEAALGTEIKVPTLDGAPVTLRIPAGTPSGKTFRVRGSGVPKHHGAGDLLVTVDVVVPKRLSAKERQAVEALAAASTTSPREHLEV